MTVNVKAPLEPLSMKFGCRQTTDCHPENSSSLCHVINSLTSSRLFDKSCWETSRASERAFNDTQNFIKRRCVCSLCVDFSVRQHSGLSFISGADDHMLTHFTHHCLLQHYELFMSLLLSYGVRSIYSDSSGLKVSE